MTPLRARVCIRDESDLVVARRKVRELGARTGLSGAALEALATAVTEVARNIVIHAGSGELVIEAISTNSPERGLMVIAQDTGPGIADIERAMRDGHSTAGGLGLGLPGARRLVDEFAIESTAGAGTTVTLSKWAPREQRR